MGPWLFPIIGVVVIGVLVELFFGDTKMGKFVRAIYSFVILFVIVQPIPKLLKEKISFFENDMMLSVNGELLEEIQGGINGANGKRVEALLERMGYSGSVVVVDGSSVYITVDGFVSPIAAKKIKATVAAELSVSADNIFVM